jgi:hypothetical protein
MSGVSVIWYLLKTNSALLAVVPATQIMAGVIPQGTPLPAISVAEISSTDRLNINTKGPRLVTERVQVTADCTGYPQQKQVLDLILAACPSTRGTVNGVVCDSILPDVKGPDMSDTAAGFYSQSRDFIVRFTRA